MLNSFQEGVLIICCVNVIAVLGMSVLTGFTRAVFLWKRRIYVNRGLCGGDLQRAFHLPFVLSVIIGAAMAGVISYILGSLTIRLRGDYFLISCLGFGECVRVLFNYTKNLTGGANGYSNIPYKTNGVIAVFCAVLAFVIAWNFIHSRYGQALSAIRENEVAAANGINVVRYKKMSFVFSAIYAGWGGALYAHYLRFITPSLFNLGKSSELVDHYRSWRSWKFNRKRSRYDHCADSAGNFPEPFRVPYAVLWNCRCAGNSASSKRPVRLPGVQPETCHWIHDQSG